MTLPSATEVHSPEALLRLVETLLIDQVASAAREWELGVRCYGVLVGTEFSNLAQGLGHSTPEDTVAFVTNLIAREGLELPTGSVLTHAALRPRTRTGVPEWNDYQLVLKRG